MRTLADVTEVHGTSTFGEEKKSIKALEKERRWLMDRTQDSLAIAGELFHQVAYRPGGLAVQSGSRLVEKEKELWASGKLNTNGQSLAF